MRKIQIIFLVLLLVGCDTFYGISQHSNPFSPFPDVQCVLNSANSIKGVSNLEYSTEEGSRVVTLSGIQKPEVVHRFRYIYNEIESDFYIVQSYNDKATFGHSYGGLNWKPPQEDIDNIYPLFEQLEAHLRKDCNFQNMQVHGYCSGVKCPSI
ncbi:hypothetical protein ACNH6B_01760 [Shewanella basaltis]|uniref:hypothetical protein n=1 Tax=Shewanella basaltis TaxID=472183 RepID=UPI003AAE48F5